MQPGQSSFVTLEQHLRGMKIVAGALIFALVVFAMIATFARGGEPNESGMTLVMGVMIAGEAVAFFVVPSGLFRAAIQKVDVSDKDDDALRLELAPIYSGMMIVRFALCEGAGFFAGIVWMIESNPIALATIGTLLLIQCIMFPAQHSVENWIDEQLERLRAA